MGAAGGIIVSTALFVGPALLVIFVGASNYYALLGTAVVGIVAMITAMVKNKK